MATKTEAGKIILTVWLPPIFRPDGTSSGSKILQARLAQFMVEHPKVQIIVRIKAESGPGGLRETLALAAEAAPESMPDIIALNQQNLRAAALKGLILDLQDDWPTELLPDMFPFAIAISRMEQEANFGVPFAADAIVLSSRLPLPAVPQRWDEIQSGSQLLHLPLGDSRSLVAFFCYYASGGIPLTSAAVLELNPQPLEDTLVWLAGLKSQYVLSGESFEIDSLENSIFALSSGGDIAITSFAASAQSRWMLQGYPPTPDGREFSMATGWSWAITNRNPSHREEAAALLAWLSDPQFLADWNLAMNLLPTSSTSLELWPANSRKVLVSGLLANAAAYPPDEVAAALGPVFSQAIQWVLNDGTEPAVAAADAVRIISPK